MQAPKLTAAAGPAIGSARKTDDVLNLLARAVRQFHTYPPASTMCLDAVSSCLDALVSLEDRDQLQARVSPAALIVDDTAIGAGTMIEHELSRRLHRAGVAAVVIDRAATPRDLTRFCLDLLTCSASHATGHSTPSVPQGSASPTAGSVATLGSPASEASSPRLHELLADHGVDKVAVQMAHRPEVLPIRTPEAPVLNLVELERARREATFTAGGPVAHLYPPDKGWVRVDPIAGLSSVSLADLALLVDDPGALATMLMRLTDEELPEQGARDVALSQKFSDIATVFASLEPRLARVMFGRLARAVLALDENRRRELLRRTILPALLDGKIDGTILRDFPDVDLADSLCLLLDLETAAPEVLATALDRLDLGEERRAAVAPLLEERLQQRELDDVERPAQGGADEYARKLIAIRQPGETSLAEFAAFDLAVDEDTVISVNALVDAIVETDLAAAQIRCLRSLVRLEPNPALVERFLAASASLVAGFERTARWSDIAAWASEHQALAAALGEHRPDVAAAIDGALTAFCTPERVGRILDLAQQDETRTLTPMLLAAFGPAAVPSVLHVLATAPAPQWRAAVQVLCDDAARLAPMLSQSLENAPAPVARAIVRVLGHAGGAYTRRINEQLSNPDEQVVREALRALTRIATAPAAALVAARVREGPGWLAAAAEETLWHFPAAEARRQVRELLERRDFVMRQPATAGRLIDRVSQGGATGLESTLAGIATLRFRLWNPALVRVARKARALAGTHP